jgi:small subunit ribosomal protein S4e
LSRHLKRYSAPKHWGLKTKAATFAARPSPGPHPGDQGVPLLGIVRDLLGYAQDMREAKRILQQGDVSVDHVTRKDYKYAAGLMDVVSIEKTGEHFRMLPDKTGLRIQPISDSESKFKLLRIQGKSWVRGGKLQLNLHDGTNVVLPGSDSPKYSVGDVIQMSLPDKEVKDHMKMEPGNAAIVSGGKNSGELGKIEKVEKGTGTQPNLATVSVGDREFQTLEEYIFVLGRKRPKIKVM